ncbi:MAG: hypothetical protein NT069_33245 [Planctomycetota bacterium]|nr:hypothetical protein [Planctomycetota bacterium]
MQGEREAAELAKCAFTRSTVARNASGVAPTSRDFAGPLSGR